MFNSKIQGYPQRLRLQRRLYGIYSVCFLIFTIPCIFKLISFYAKSFKTPLKDSIKGRKLIQYWDLAYRKNFQSFFQCHPLWVTLYLWVKQRQFRGGGAACSSPLPPSFKSLLKEIFTIFQHFFYFLNYRKGLIFKIENS